MPTPPSERRALEQERDGLPGQIAAYRRELEMTEHEQRARRDRLDWQIQNLEQRLAAIEARLAAIRAES
jgi:hypothetical protein